jgi:DNA-binding response OmpR family regulator
LQRDFCYYELKSNHINFVNFSNSIRVHISALRKKLRAALGYDPIRNRIGEGYVMEEEKE